jgi:poly(A) polymerase
MGGDGRDDREPVAAAGVLIAPGVWRGMPGLERVLDALGPGNARPVGGAVRDTLLGEAVADVDLATVHAPHEAMRRLEGAGLKVVPTGLKHGTVTAVSHGRPYEVTTLRRDVDTDGRHAAVEFTNDWRADAARRDFTINALYADVQTGEVLDWFGGEADLEARRVRFIGEPLVRIAEDHLRILRFFRFSARFGRAVDPEGLAACVARVNDLMALSRERIRDELLRLLALPCPVPTLRVMLEHGVLKPVLPEVQGERIAVLETLCAAEREAGVAADGLRRLAALLPDDAGVAADIAARLRLSRAEGARLVHAAGREGVTEPAALAYAIGAEAALDRLLLTGDTRAVAWAPQLRVWTRPRMPVTGKDLIAMGVPPGPQVSRLLGEVERRWVASGFVAARERVLAIAREVMGVR